MKSSSLKRLDIITLFPAMFEGPLSQSLLGRARARGLVDVRIHDLRIFSDDPKHHKVDDRPYGGGAGMVISAEPIYRALKSIKSSGGTREKPYVIFMSPQGGRLNQAAAGVLVRKPWLIFLCGHYEGIDERAMSFMDEEVSIGDFVLTGGELPAMVLAEAIIRLIPGVVKESAGTPPYSGGTSLLEDYRRTTRRARAVVERVFYA